MIYLSLPNYMQYITLYNNFYQHIRCYPDALKENLGISDVSGNFPYLPHQSGPNLNGAYTHRLLFGQFSECILSSSTAMRFDCSNIFLTADDYEDVNLRLILEQGNNGCNKISVSSIEFYEHLKETYPNYRYVFSHNAHYMHPTNAEIINMLTEQFDLVEISPLLEQEELEKIKDKSKVEILIGDYCKPSCKYYKECHTGEQEYILNFSKKSFMLNCAQPLYRKPNFTNYYDEIQYYKTLGFSHFRIQDPTGILSPIYYEELLYKSFFQEHIYATICAERGLVTHA